MWVAADISVFSIKRNTVACPTASALLSTSKCRLARTAPFQQAIAVVASRPATNAWAFTTDRWRRRKGLNKVKSRSTTARFAARARKGGACNTRNACSAPSMLCTTLTPKPPEVPFAFSTIGKPIRAIHVSSSSALATTVVFGTRIPSVAANSMNAALAYMIGKSSGAPSEFSISTQIDSPALPWRRLFW